MAALPTTMREIIFDGAGGPDVIKLREAPVPAPGPGKVLVEVAAAGINRPDCIQRAGLYPPPPGETASSRSRNRRPHRGARRRRERSGCGR